jgi:hypothetical protein
MLSTLLNANTQAYLSLLPNFNKKQSRNYSADKFRLTQASKNKDLGIISYAHEKCHICERNEAHYTTYCGISICNGCIGWHTEKSPNGKSFYSSVCPLCTGG